MGMDGTLGLRAIKESLWMAMAQTPETAKYDSMPMSAIETGLADYVLPPEKMGEHLVEYAKRATFRVAPGAFHKDGEATDAMQKIYILLRAQTGHDFSFIKPIRSEAYREEDGCPSARSCLKLRPLLQENPRKLTSCSKDSDRYYPIFRDLKPSKSQRKDFP
jgi:two-component system CheB/CheR fusion protein